MSWYSSNTRVLKKLYCIEGKCYHHLILALWSKGEFIAPLVYIIRSTLLLADSHVS